MDREERLIFKGQEREIEQLKEIIKFKDSIINQYERVLKDVGAKLEIIRDECTDPVMYLHGKNDKNMTMIVSHEIEFSRYQFAYKYEVQDMMNRTKLLSK